MAWDFAETNVFAHAAGDFGVSIDGIVRTLTQFGNGSDGHVLACDSQSQSISLHKVISTDPPYYDNIGYADLSDFFYVWLRHSLKTVFPDLFSTLAVPKAEELVAQASADQEELAFCKSVSEQFQEFLWLHVRSPRGRGGG